MKSVFFVVTLFVSQLTLAADCTETYLAGDFYTAIDICQKEGNKGNGPAQLIMGIMYFQGQGVLQNMTKAQEWMRKAAQNNQEQAQYNLGLLLVNDGQGSVAEIIEGFAWLKISMEKGYEPAKDSIDKLQADMSSKEKQRAEEKVTELKQKFKL